MKTFDQTIKQIVLDAYKWGLWNIKINGDEPAVKKWSKEALEAITRSDSDTLKALVDNMESELERRSQESMKESLA